jgi:hypothetical protein
MEMNLFLWLLVAHFVGDYIFHMNKLSVVKRGPEPTDIFIGNLVHAWIHFMCIWFIGAIFIVVGVSGSWTRISILVFLAHFTIDFVRCILEVGVFKFEPMVIGPRKALMMFLGGDTTGLKRDFKHVVSAITDQIIHVGSLYWISQL